MESQPQNPEFRNNPDNFHPCIQIISPKVMGHLCSDLSGVIQLVVQFFVKIIRLILKPLPGK